MGAYHRALLAYAFGLVATTGGPHQVTAPPVYGSKPKRHISRMPHQGKRERERRMRQMAKAAS